MFGRATITLGIGRHSSLFIWQLCMMWVLTGGEGQVVFTITGEVCKDVERRAAEAENTGSQWRWSRHQYHVWLTDGSCRFTTGLLTYYWCITVGVQTSSYVTKLLSTGCLTLMKIYWNYFSSWKSWKSPGILQSLLEILWQSSAVLSIMGATILVCEI